MFGGQYKCEVHKSDVSNVDKCFNTRPRVNREWIAETHQLISRLKRAIVLNTSFN